MKTLTFFVNLTMMISTTYAQYSNPYEQFGCKSVVLKESSIKPNLTITNDNKTLSITNGFVIIQALNDSMSIIYKIPPEMATRWLSTDPIVKEHESPYASFANSPIWIVDPTGMDSVFYDQSGAELPDFRVVNNDMFNQSFMQHNEGNVSIGDEQFYQGLTKESFFGDRTDKDSDKRFEVLDKTSIPTIKDAVKMADQYVPDSENFINYLRESPGDHLYDFKNTVLKEMAPGKNNANTAYLVNGIVFNRNEAGNIMWGAGANKVGISPGVALGGVQGFSVIDEGKFDEMGEQLSILLGWSGLNNVRK